MSVSEKQEVLISLLKHAAERTAGLVARSEACYDHRSRRQRNDLDLTGGIPALRLAHHSLRIRS